MEQQSELLMDQEVQHPEAVLLKVSAAPLPEQADDDVQSEPLAPLAESTFVRYLREYRMLNSMLITLVVTVTFLLAYWS